MLRYHWLACATLVAGACSNSAGRHENDRAPEKVALPTGPQNPGTPQGPATAKAAPADDARFHLRAEEGTLTIDKVEGKAGAALVAQVVVTPASGLHIATDYPIKITLTPPSGVVVAKAELSAGGRDKAAGDAAELTEQRLRFAIAATPDKPGAYEVTGTFKFGICDKDSCHPKRQPIAIAIAAN